MKTLLLLLLVALLHFSFAQTKEHVCLPCGRECDNHIYEGPGQCSSCGMKLVEKSTLRFTNVSIGQLCEGISKNPKAVLLDVRSEGEFKGSTTEVPSYGHFKNAININVNDLEKRVEELKKFKDSEIFVYCSHAHRSAVASYFLSTHGFKNVKNMLGGVSTLANQQSDCLSQSFVAHNH
jgi:rhodanese-related sulfurtransferase/DNA-directed RNA polymerase subunit RPC12/RpoP